MSDYAELVYKCTGYYAYQYECSLLWDDPDLGIKWPLVVGNAPCLSDKDNAGGLFKDMNYFP